MWNIYGLEVIDFELDRVACMLLCICMLLWGHMDASPWHELKALSVF